MADDDVQPLYCDTCHTKWIEACLLPRGPCPFVDCGGTLTYAEPSTMTRPVRFVRDRSTPLLDAAGLDARPRRGHAS